MKNLREKATSMNSGKGITFMEGREKGDIKDLFNRIVEVVDYDFLQGDNGKYVVFIIKQDPKNFYFGGTVMTDNFLNFDEEDKLELQMQGLPIMLEEKQNKKGTRSYQNVVFYPGSNEDLPF